MVTMCMCVCACLDPILLKVSPQINTILQYLAQIALDEDKSDSNLSGAIGLLG